MQIITTSEALSRWGALLTFVEKSLHGEKISMEELKERQIALQRDIEKTGAFDGDVIVKEFDNLFL